MHRLSKAARNELFRADFWPGRRLPIQGNASDETRHDTTSRASVLSSVFRIVFPRGKYQYIRGRIRTLTRYRSFADLAVTAASIFFFLWRPQRVGSKYRTSLHSRFS